MAEVVKVIADRESRKRDGIGARVPDHLALLKPRVMSLVVFTGAVGMAVAPGSISWVNAATTLICMAAGAGGCGALNMWYDADIDGLMQRTAGRPIPSNRVAAREALITGTLLSILSVLVLGTRVNPMAGALLALTIGIYVPLYTMFLKRRTSQNIVIGGAAGALPPVIGWAAVTGSADPGALSLFLIIFLWTPPHFWSLAIAFHDDYAAAKVPMLPVVIGDARAARTIFACAALLVAASLVPAVIGMGALYLTTAIGAGAYLLVKSAQLLRAPNQRAAMANFHASLAYLALLIGAAIADASLKL